MVTLIFTRILLRKKVRAFPFFLPCPTNQLNISFHASVELQLIEQKSEYIFEKSELFQVFHENVQCLLLALPISYGVSIIPNTVLQASMGYFAFQFLQLRRVDFLIGGKWSLAVTSPAKRGGLFSKSPIQVRFIKQNCPHLTCIFFTLSFSYDIIHVL